MTQHWQQRAADRATLLARGEDESLAERITSVCDYLIHLIESDPDPDSRLPRWGEALNYLCLASREDWHRTTGIVLDFNNESDK